MGDHDQILHHDTYWEFEEQHVLGALKFIMLRVELRNTSPTWFIDKYHVQRRKDRYMICNYIAVNVWDVICALTP